MELKIKDLAKLLNISEKTIYRFIKDKKIPYYKIGHRYRFIKQEINEWVLNNKVNITGEIINLNKSVEPVNFCSLVKNGGIFYRVTGDKPSEIIKNTVNLISTPKDLDKNVIIYHLLQRERMMPTAVGRGIAIPHARSPIITDIENESVSICFLEHPVH